MRRVALKGLVFRRLRTVLTALAVVLGVAMISGTYVLTDTISKAFDDIFTSSYANTSAVISGRQVVKTSASGNATVPESLLATVRRLPGVGPGGFWPVSVCTITVERSGTRDSLPLER